MMDTLKIPQGHESDVFVVSVSGGKDSTATALALREAGIPFRAVFADTGWEAAQTYEHLEVIERRLGLTIARVGLPGGMVAAIRERAGFPARKQRWCTRKLKVELLRAWHDDLMDREDVDTVSVVGIRAEESEERSAMPVFGYDDLWGGYTWRPMRDATVEEIILLHHRHGMPLNTLYKMGFGRVGCNPCIYATKEEIALTAQYFPARIVQIRGLEAECTALRAERNAEEPDRYAYSQATFFQAKLVDHYTTERRWIPAPKNGRRPKGRLSEVQGPPPAEAHPDGTWRDVRVPHYKAMSIDDVIAWSNTDRGGRQLKVFREEPQGGCFRWGMCEPPLKDKEE